MVGHGAPPTRGIVSAALPGLLLVGFLLTYGHRDAPRQFGLIRDVRANLAGLTDGERRIETFYELPARRRLYRQYFELIEEVRRETPEDARIGFVGGMPRYLFRFAPYYLHPRHAFELSADGPLEAAKALEIDTLVRTRFDDEVLRYGLEHAD